MENNREGFISTVLSAVTTIWNWKALFWHWLTDKSIITVKYNANFRSTMDLYIPQQKIKNKYPVFLIVGGCGYIFGCKLFGIPLAFFLRKIGYFAIVIDYNRYPSDINQQCNTFANAISWIVNNISSPKYNGDINNMMIVGFSASSHIILKSVLNQIDNIKNNKISFYNPNIFKSLALCSTPYDLVKAYQSHKYSFIEGWFLRHYFKLKKYSLVEKENIDISKYNSTILNKFCIKYLFEEKIKNKEITPKDIPSLIIVHAKQDTTCHFECAVRFHLLLQKNGYKTKFHTMNGDHITYAINLHKNHNLSDLVAKIMP